MLWEFPSRSRDGLSPWVIGLLLVGTMGWLTPMVAAALRPHRASPVKPDEIILGVNSASELCVQGTSVAGAKRYALFNGKTIALGETVKVDQQNYRIVEITTEQVHLHRVK